MSTKRKKKTRRAKNPTVPSLLNLCFQQIFTVLEHKGFHPRLINDLCKRIPSTLLEPILEHLLIKRAVTDVALLFFLVPDRTKLKINGAVHLRNSTLKQIGYNCNNLRTLNLSDCVQVGNSVVRSVLHGCPHLSDLRLDRCHRVTDAAFDPNQSIFESLVACLSLEAISLQGCPQISGTVVLTLNKLCLKLKYLNLSQCKNIQAEAVHELFEHQQLLSLNISFVDGVSDAAFGASSFQGSHSRSTSQNTIDKSEHVDRSTPVWIASSPPRSSEENQGAPLNNGVRSASDEMHNALESHDAAKGRSLVESRWTAMGRKGGSRKSKLRNLNIGRSSITDLSIFRMSFLSSLTEIHLQWCAGITDAGVVALTEHCLALQRIDLKSCAITDVAVEAVAQNCKWLQWLDLSWCSAVADTGIAALVRHCLHHWETASPRYVAQCRELKSIIENAVNVNSESSPGDLKIYDSSEQFLLPFVPEMESEGQCAAAGVLPRIESVDPNGEHEEIGLMTSTPVDDGVIERKVNCAPLSAPQALHNVGLRFVSVVWCPLLTDESLVSLALLPTLESIDIGGNPNFSAEMIESITHSGVSIAR